jgi:hypothetical protein
MKNFLFLITLVLLISCTKDASVQNMDKQKGRKQKTTEVSFTLSTSVVVDWTPEDNIISLDSAKPVIENVGAGTDLYWSVRADESMLPQRNIHVSIWVDSATIGGVFHPAHWTAVGNENSYINAPGGAGKIFSGNANPAVYRAAFWDKNYIWHYSSPYQVN